MALIIPEYISSTANQGQKNLYKLFQDKLPNDFLVWVNQNVLDTDIDFIVIAPNFGVLIIKVLTYYFNQIINVENNKIQFQLPDENQQISLNISERRKRKRSSHSHRNKSHYQWCASEYEELLYKLSLKLETYPSLMELDRDDKPHQLAFPLGYAIVFSNITHDQYKEKNIPEILPTSQIVYRNELIDWQQLSSDILIDRLKTIFTKNYHSPNLTSEQIETIKAIVFPEITIKIIPPRNYTLDHSIEASKENFILKTLDHRQECIVRSIGEGHRIIYGVAGSGKTLILLCHAKLLLKQNHKLKILILCFNRSLAAYLKSQICDVLEDHRLPGKIQVLTFYAWVKSFNYKIPSPRGFSTEYYDSILADILLDKLVKTPESQKYDAILVDEGQTFHPNWFKCCVAALKDPENGNLMIVADGSQSIYKRHNFTWKSVGIKAIGRTSNKRFHLDKNYRNTHEILVAAWGLITYEQNNNNILNQNLTFEAVKPTDAVRYGLSPVLHIENSENQEVEAVIRQIQEFQKLGFNLNEVAILYRMADDQKILLLDNLRQKLQTIGIDTYWVSQTRESEKEYSHKKSGIKLISTLSALGLEFKIVLILWVQDWEFNIPPTSENDLITCQRLYVAMTRAQDILHIFGSGNSTLIRQLQFSGNFTVKQG